MKLITDIDPLSSRIPMNRLAEFDTITKQFSEQCALTVRQTDGLLKLLYQTYLTGEGDYADGNSVFPWRDDNA